MTDMPTLRLAKPDLTSLTRHPISGLLLWLSLSMGVSQPASGEIVLTASNTVASPGTTVVVEVELHHLENEIIGWSYGVCSDPQVVVPDSVSAPLTFSPAFLSQNLFSEGVTQTVVVDFLGASPLPPGMMVAQEVTYLSVGQGADVATLSFCESLSNPPILIEIAVGPNLFEAPVLAGGQITVVVDDPHFIRGDVDGSGSVSLGDCVSVLAYLFANGSVFCEQAADFDDNEQVSLGDAIVGLSFLFTGGLAPSSPTTCGPDPTLGPLSCLQPPCP